MSNKPRILDSETRARHINKLRELNRCMDKYILDLDELNAKLEAELLEQRRRMYNLRQAKQLAPSEGEY